MLGDIEVQHLPTTMFQHDQYEQHLHPDRRHGEQVHGYRLAEVVVEKRLPGLGWWPADRSDDSGNSTLRDRKAEHLQFAVDPRCAPERIGRHHPLNQPAHLGGSGGAPPAARVWSRASRAESAETVAVPLGDSIPLDI